MMFKLGKKSQKALIGVHPDIIKVINRALEISVIDFTVIEGLRTLERQKVLYAAGATKTLKSRHLTGHAVDLAPYINGSIRWDWPLFYKIADAMKAASKELGIPLEWGGDWKSFKDGPHWQLPKDVI